MVIYNQFGVLFGHILVIYYLIVSLVWARPGTGGGQVSVWGVAHTNEKMRSYDKQFYGPKRPYFILILTPNGYIFLKWLPGGQKNPLIFSTQRHRIWPSLMQLERAWRVSMIALDERSWLCSGPEIWPNLFFLLTKIRIWGCRSLGGVAPWTRPVGLACLEHARFARYPCGLVPKWSKSDPPITRRGPGWQ